MAFLLAGVSAMRLVAFQLANVPGAITWAFVMPKSGELGGTAIGALWRTLFGA